MTTLRRPILPALLALAFAAGPALATGVGDMAGPAVCQQRLAIANEAGRPVQEIFLRNAGATAWGPDRLGDALLRPGQSIELATAGPVDVMVMLADGTARALWRLESCQVRRVSLTAALALRAE